MSAERSQNAALPEGSFGSTEEGRKNIKKRRQIGVVWRVLFYVATTIAILTLLILLVTIIDGAFGFVAIKNKVEPETLSELGLPLAELPREELVEILEENLTSGLLRRFNSEQPLLERSVPELVTLVEERVVEPEIIKAWNLFPSLFSRSAIDAHMAQAEPGTRLQFRAWLSLSFITNPQSPDPQFAGVRTALLGSVWMMLVTIVFAFPLGVGAAIYLEEYAKDSRLNRLLQVNIYNLAGIPSIIYGLLGLALFVRILGPITSGAFLGLTTTANPTGRTIVSAGMTLGLLILPIIIISSQEAIRAVPQSLRESSYGLGGTKWQTIWYHVLPAAFDRILTGTILAVSRAVGETAPLILTGAATVIFIDPANLFSQFTALPIQIYQWSSRPQGEFRNVAAAAILVLLVLLLSMNAFAIIFRDRIQKRRLI